MKRIVTLFIIASIIMTNIVCAEGISEESYCTGALKMTEEQHAEFIKKTPEIKDVRFNDIAKERIYGENAVYLADDNDLGKLIVCDTDIDEGNVMTTSSVQLPSYVDNSTKDHFPPIGDQGHSNSCTAWSAAYYQMTNNIAATRGYNTKSGTNAKDYIMSPKWMYNLINDGKDEGSSLSNAMNVAACYGGASWTDCNGETKPNNYKSWNPGAEIWENALKNKIARGAYLDINKNNGIELLKKLLVNGFVVSFSTDSPKLGGLDNWKTKSGTANSIIQSICYYVKKDNGGHTMTIVGYDDNAWVDVNDNGIKEEAETGAFKIANSWGTGWGNKGYIWLLYDALSSTTTIPNVSNQIGRVDAFWDNEVYFLEPMKSYTPLVVAEVSINTARRDQLDIEIGISDTSETSPHSIMNIAEFTGVKLNDNNDFPWYNAIAFSLPSGSMNFTGGSISDDGIFTFDLTPILGKYISNGSNMLNGGTTARLYIKITDAKSDSYETKLTELKIIDRTNNIQSSSITYLPIIANGNSKMAYSDIKIVPNVVNKDKTFNAEFSSPIREECINNSNFYVVNNRTNENVLTSLNQSSDRKNVSISSEISYERGNFYNLCISSNILSLGGNQLSEPKEFEFYIP